MEEKNIKFNQKQLVSIELEKGGYKENIKFHQEKRVIRKSLFGLIKNEKVTKEWYQDKRWIGRHPYLEDCTDTVLHAIKSNRAFVTSNNDIFASPRVIFRFSNGDEHIENFGPDKFPDYWSALDRASNHYGSNAGCIGVGYFTIRFILAKNNHHVQLRQY